MTDEETANSNAESRSSAAERIGATLGWIAGNAAQSSAVAAVSIGFYRVGAIGWGNEGSDPWLFLAIAGLCAVIVLSTIGGRYQNAHGLNIFGRPNRTQHPPPDRGDTR